MAQYQDIETTATETEAATEIIEIRGNARRRDIDTESYRQGCQRHSGRQAGTGRQALGRQVSEAKADTG
eukprot:745608-Hanusia_phi.AAC.1